MVAGQHLWKARRIALVALAIMDAKWRKSVDPDASSVSALA